MWGKIGFQDAVRPIIHRLLEFYNYAMIFITLIRVYVILIISFLQYNQKEMVNIGSAAHLVEAVWTILPAIVLSFLALPSLRLLYMLDEVQAPLLSVKVVGNQWYWTYDYMCHTFDSYMKIDDELMKGDIRLLEVDNRIVLPYNAEVRLLVTSADVLHSWRIPALGLKVDAIPGRLNQITRHVLMPGVYYGRCTEICGVNHSFIPIVLEIVNMPSWLKWHSVKS